VAGHSAGSQFAIRYEVQTRSLRSLPEWKNPYRVHRDVILEVVRIEWIHSSLGRCSLLILGYEFQRTRHFNELAGVVAQLEVIIGPHRIEEFVTFTVHCLAIRVSFCAA
jgi:hypothetical protein